MLPPRLHKNSGKAEKGRRSPVERWAEKISVSDDGCWHWRGSLNERGYGMFWFERKLVKAHRFSYLVYYGEIQDGLHVLHSCDVRDCVNPSHLRLGTHAENMQDMAHKGRGQVRRGDECSFSKLTESQVRDILKSPETGPELSRTYGVSRNTIYAIRNGKNWRHIHASA